MGLFDKVFKSERDIAKKEIEKLPWHPLTQNSQLDELVAESEKEPVVIFKHSTRCGISRMVLSNLERNYDLPKDEKVKLYFLDLLANRGVSNEVADRFNVRHESPQMIVIRNGKAVDQTSHNSISVDVIKKHIERS
jgi:bacillithiol system protein YtxJ